MGWAKYYEDNISIYNNRMAMMETRMPVRHACHLTKELEVNKQGLNPTSLKGEYKTGIMLSFTNVVDNSVARKLQMNGWWFSRANNCWCNYNNPSNRKYAQRFIMHHMAIMAYAS